MNDPLKKYRILLRGYNNRRRLKKELCRYERLFKAKDLAIPDETIIENSLRNKYSHIRPKKKGELHIIAIYHHYNWEDYSLKPALNKFGRVRVYDWFDEFNHQKKNWRTSAKDEMNTALIRIARNWVEADSTDIIFSYLSGELVSPDAMETLRSLGVPMINLSLNDKESFIGKVRNGQAAGMRDICRYFDLCWTSTEDSLKKYCVEGAVPVYLPEGANPDIHRPYDHDKIFDVSFVGQCYGNRPDIIHRLKGHGIHVEAFGAGWPNGSLTTEDMVGVYSKSRINLGFSGVAGHGDTYCIKGRDFEIPMSGGLYLTEYHPELERFFNVEREIAVYRDFEDLLEKIKFLLSNPDKAEIIRRSGFQRACREHTWEMRFEKIFTLLGLI
jgi:hypothetical protein